MRRGKQRAEDWAREYYIGKIAATKKAKEERETAENKAREACAAAAKKAKEEKVAAANKAQEEKVAAANKAREEKVAAKKAKKETNATVCRQQYQEQYIYHNGPQKMPIVVPMNDAMLGIIGPVREGQFCDTYMLQV